MQIFVNTVDEYIASIPEDRKEAVSKLRKTLLENLPEGFEERTSYGMIGYVVPHSLYPNGYHCTPEQPLPFMNVASQKNFIALYHMGLYSSPDLLEWFKTEYPKHCKYKLDMGKGCVRFKKTDDIPYELIAELTRKISLQDWITQYESMIKGRK
ncbi:iron chaperone [Pedobacter punctiformis]|uniref:DUF1801 domain-containing protein n=1 Tax=Pedobacter punctiformis TaxID=3004097 RepID=A0ABT4LD26_9SPHI|nr:DUF1801 domain-containing protein [Pedobacter sp. HCMS5-2]MCZ4245798.1 DUF1801 domain-containing protein [Pedobacter sp. HCMS5-2]